MFFFEHPPAYANLLDASVSFYGEMNNNIIMSSLKIYLKKDQHRLVQKVELKIQKMNLRVPEVDLRFVVLKLATSA